MAIIEDLGLSVTIEVNGTPLEEYNDAKPSEDSTVDQTVTKVCSKYVEAKDGAEYIVHCKAMPNKPGFRAPRPKTTFLSLTFMSMGSSNGARS